MYQPWTPPAFWTNTAGGFGYIGGNFVTPPSPTVMAGAPLTNAHSYMDREIVPPPSSAAYPRLGGKFVPPPSPVYIAGDFSATSPCYIAGESPANTPSTTEEEEEIIIISDDDDSWSSSSHLSRYYRGSETSIVSLNLGGNIRDRVVDIECYYNYHGATEETWSIGVERDSTSDWREEEAVEEVDEMVEEEEEDEKMEEMEELELELQEEEEENEFEDEEEFITISDSDSGK
ncbi:hypothetical protein DMENIID0001_068440 [Sergentomyia squamirostris]